jgi:hypothetical protein
VAISISRTMPDPSPVGSRCGPPIGLPGDRSAHVALERTLPSRQFGICTATIFANRPTPAIVPFHIITSAPLRRSHVSSAPLRRSRWDAASCLWSLQFTAATQQRGPPLEVAAWRTPLPLQYPALLIGCRGGGGWSVGVERLPSTSRPQDRGALQHRPSSARMRVKGWVHRPWEGEMDSVVGAASRRPPCRTAPSRRIHRRLTRQRGLRLRGMGRPHETARGRRRGSSARASSSEQGEVLDQGGGDAFFGSKLTI